MIINEKKTKFMVINGSPLDRRPFSVNDITVGCTSKYVYLGAHFTDDGRLSIVLKLHSDSCFKHVNKFVCFVRKKM